MVYKFNDFFKLNEEIFTGLTFTPSVQDEVVDDEVQEEEEDPEEDEEPSEEEVEENYRNYLEGLSTADLMEYVGSSRIFYYVDDDKYIDDWIDGEVDYYMSDSRTFSEICDKNEVSEFLSNAKKDEKIRDWRREQLRDEFEDDEEYEWELDMLEDKSVDDILDDIDDKDKFVELLEELDLEEDYARNHLSDMYKDAEDIVLNFCRKDDTECIMNHIENYIDEKRIIDDIISDTDYYTMKEFYN